MAGRPRLTRGLVALTLPCCLIAPAAPPASASDDSAVRPDACTVRRLEHLPGETRSEVTGGSPSGRWVVGCVEVGFSLHTVRWVGPAPRGDPGRAARLVADRRERRRRRHRHRHRVEQLRGLRGARRRVHLAGKPGRRVRDLPVAISGDRIAGHSELDDGTVRPFVWLFDQPDDAVPLPLPAGHSGFVVGMTPRGRVVVAATRVGPTRSRVRVLAITAAA